MAEFVPSKEVAAMAAMDQAILEVAAKVADCVDAQEETSETLSHHSDELTEVRMELLALKEKNCALEKKLDNMDAGLIEMKEDIGLVKRDVIQNSQALKIANLVIDGLVEKEGENCKESVITVLKIMDKGFSANDIIATYRVGQKSEGTSFNRPILVKLGDPMVKQRIMEQKGLLMKHPTYSQVFLNDDLPPSIKRERQMLREIGKRAHQLGYQNVKTTGSKVIIDGKSYRHSELHLLPDNLQIANIKTREIGDGIGFQGEESFLSNFYKVTFKLRQHTFTSAEQAYFFFKARICKKEEAAMTFLGMSNPRQIKKDGDQIPSTAVWEANKEGFMRSIVYAKFAQNSAILEKLLNTGESPLYECTRNRWWGCGLRFDAPEWRDLKVVPGLNKLGKILMEVRSALRKTTRKEAALVASPGALIRSIAIQSQEIEKKAGETARSVTDISNIDSHLSSEESMDILDEEEESVGIAASSDISTSSSKSTSSTKQKQPRAMDITDADGKIDVSKIRSWSLPRIGKHKRSRSGGYIAGRTRNQKPQENQSPTLVNEPRAHSTPHVDGNKSATSTGNKSVLEQVRDKLSTSKRRKVSGPKDKSKSHARNSVK